MTISITDHFHLNKEAFGRSGAFDAILDEDTPLFINPSLLKKTTIPELTNSYETVLEHFRHLIKILEQSSKKGDAAYKDAFAFFKYNEAPEICLGHGKQNTAGERHGTWIKERILSTVRDMVQAGIKEPETFEVAAWLAPQMGPDRVSDMLASISRNSLRSYSTRVFKESGLKTKRFQWKDGFLPAHPFLKKEDGSPVELHLVPAEILSSSVAARTDLQQLTADLRRIVLRTSSPKNAPRADKYKQKAIEELLRRPERARQIPSWQIGI
jgi:hypothetical protein